MVFLAVMIVRQAELDGDRARGVTSTGEKDGDYCTVEPPTKDFNTFDKSLCTHLEDRIQDLPMILNCLTKSAAFMAKPCMRSWNKLKRVARFMKLHQRRTREFIGQEKRTVLKVSADSD